MMKKTFLAMAVLMLTASLMLAGEPDGTYMFAKRDTCNLFLDLYKADPGDSLGSRRPVIVFVFGGGFMQGSRRETGRIPWYRELNKAGYDVAAIDYRLGLKNLKDTRMRLALADSLEHAINIAVEDLFSATRYLIDNSDRLGIDPAKIIACGSSAGAITAMQAEWEICNGMKAAVVLPSGFNYAGVISLSGAIFSRKGGIHYASAPCPVAMFQGTSDKVVPYKKIALLGMTFAGTDALGKIFIKNGYNYNIYRFKNRTHEISVAFMPILPEVLRFLDENVMKGTAREVDALVDDPGIKIPSWAKANRYSNIYDK